MPIGNCEFCDEFSGCPDNAFHRVYGGEPRSRVLFRSGRLAVIPSLGQIVEGYLLILPSRHCKALGDLTATEVNELTTVSWRVGKVLAEEYGRYVLFEHGTRSEGVGGCGIYHAHLHAVPLGAISDPVEVLKAKFPYEEMADLTEISRRSAGLPCYLFYQDLDIRSYLFDTGPLPSQYLRKLLAEAMGEKVWNWRNAGREERLLATIRRLSRYFSMPNEPVKSFQPLDATP